MLLLRNYLQQNPMLNGFNPEEYDLFDFMLFREMLSKNPLTLGKGSTSCFFVLSIS